jgi:DedD protein
MAFFRFGSGQQGDRVDGEPDSIENVRRRARHRLIGATVLVIASVAGLPLLFSNQPRPIPVDIPIEIPDRNQPPALPNAKPQPAVSLGGSLSQGEESVASGTPASAAAPAVKLAEPAPVAPPVAASGKRVTEPKDTATAKPVEPVVHPREPDKAAKPSVKPTVKPAPEEPKPKPVVVPEVKPPKPVVPSDADRAQALLEGKTAVLPEQPVGATDAGPRWIVQVGAFADPVKAREARAKLESAGLKTYTHVAQTADGPRTRVRVGPFKSRAEADNVAARAKQLSLGAAVLSL